MVAALMMPRPSRARGAISWVGVALLLGAIGGGYLGWVWFPVYLSNYEVKQVVRQFANEAVKNPNDEQLVAAMVARLRSLGEVESVDESGRPVRRPMVDISPADVTWERVDPHALHVSFAYERTVELPFLARRLERVMVVDLTMDISRPDWGPSK
ncbi:MAG TPA: hypothetical protein VMK12_09455 [Anaeromyxobacteraceae bacterium]|nr:hypothetical protein [Anaeromyxobacteraceae bacterium]